MEVAKCVHWRRGQWSPNKQSKLHDMKVQMPTCRTSQFMPIQKFSIQVTTRAKGPEHLEPEILMSHD